MNEMAMIAARGGATFLGENVPGWRTRVDRDTLDMGNSGKCVLGQLYGNFWESYDPLRDIAGTAFTDNPWRWAAGHGFQASGYGSFADLDEAWRVILDERENAKPEAPSVSP